MPGIILGSFFFENGFLNIGRKEMDQVWLSILIPVYNVQSYVTECLDSVFSQLEDNIEVIILDDASTDNSFSVISQYLLNVKFNARLIQHEKNRGLSAARNTLLTYAVGEYVWFLDSDDALCSGAISSLKSIAFNYSPDLIMCDYSIWRPTLTATTEYIHKEAHIKSFAGKTNSFESMSWEFFTGLYRAGQLHSWSKISKRILWQGDLKFQEGIYFEDMVSTPRLALKASSYFYVPEVWINYRQHNTSIIATLNAAKIKHMINGLANVVSDWEKEFSSVPRYAQFAYNRFSLRTMRFVIKQLKSASIENIEEVREQLRKDFFCAVNQTKFGFALSFLMQRDLKRFVRALRI